MPAMKWLPHFPSSQAEFKARPVCLRLPSALSGVSLGSQTYKPRRSFRPSPALGSPVLPTPSYCRLPSLSSPSGSSVPLAWVQPPPVQSCPTCQPGSAFSTHLIHMRCCHLGDTEAPLDPGLLST